MEHKTIVAETGRDSGFERTAILQCRDVHGLFCFVKLPNKGWASERECLLSHIKSLFQAQPYSLRQSKKETNENGPYGPFYFVIVPTYRPYHFPIFLLKSLLKGKMVRAPSLKKAFFLIKEKLPYVPFKSRPFKKDWNPLKGPFLEPWTASKKKKKLPFPYLVPFKKP